MYQISFSLKLLLALISFMSFTSCVSQPMHLKDYPFHPTTGRKKVVNAPLRDVWVSTLRVLESYPLDVLDQSRGVLITNPVPIDDSPISSLLDVKKRFKVQNAYGLSYHLKIQLLKLSSGKLEERTEVHIQKSLSAKNHFFAKTQFLESDGLEELYILYRIQREVYIKKKTYQFITNKEKKSKKVKK